MSLYTASVFGPNENSAINESDMGSKQSSLGTLAVIPPEVRTMIYHHVLEDFFAPIIVFGSAGQPQLLTRRLGILTASRTLHDEVLSKIDHFGDFRMTIDPERASASWSLERQLIRQDQISYGRYWKRFSSAPRIVFRVLAPGNSLHPLKMEKLLKRCRNVTEDYKHALSRGLSKSALLKQDIIVMFLENPGRTWYSGDALWRLDVGGSESFRVRQSGLQSTVKLDGQDTQMAEPSHGDLGLVAWQLLQMPNTKTFEVFVPQKEGVDYQALQDRINLKARLWAER